MMKYIKKNFLVILLGLSILCMGILALSTIFRFRETKTLSPQNTAALSPGCRIEFSLKDAPDIMASVSPTILPTSPITQTPITTTPSITVVPSRTLTVAPTTIRTSPTPTRPLTISPTPTTPTSRITTPTPTAPTVSIRPTVSPTGTLIAQNPTGIAVTPIAGNLTPTIVQPDVPVSGSPYPTILAITAGILLLLASFVIRGPWIAKR